MKDLLLQYARYNQWANHRFIDVLLTLDEEKLELQIASSFSTIRETVYHMWSAEFIWLQRLELTENPVWIEDIFKGSFAEACANWQTVSKGIIDFISRQYDDRSFEHVLQYYTRQKKSFKTPVSGVLLHVFNHATYHRGQLVTMLRQAGEKKIPGTDMITFLANPRS